MSDSNAPENTPNNDEIQALPERQGSNKGLKTALIAGGVVVALGLGAFAFTRGGDDDSKLTTVKIGTTEAAAPYWPPFVKLAKENGINLEVVSFSDYTQANPALAQKQLDVNLFQHLQFLASYNVSDKQTLTPIGSSVVVPLSLYSKKHTQLSQVPQGGKVAIPNDPTNQARALLVLQQAGLLKLKNGGNTLSTPADILASESKVSVTAVDAAQTVAALPSVDASIVNNNFALDAKLDPSKALFADDPAKPAAEPYINIFVTRAADKDNPTFKKLVELYHKPQVESQVKASSKNTAVLVTKPAADLQRILADLEKNQK
ncbi:MetQ/NlpA family ABC transporter substrate-binding protein [Yimella sp. cx-51]|uniref:MetQ/NlpA family ABC transporter substrate-binding protein n=1 Tax=Yimella sp. cx-51 TaxID=2770551 RepID=UPI00165E68FD|nr:MetQ/NlpA family ABC transporter substrate-binding protein [Yimella sp. cx-51]MBC9957942.1 methionine ABC transporter substrate-binding protein [Yimella sp. cx-51]QTH38075.1 methionine ABC transporter substrate-binding protein [Yimella sp. cx-51]